MPGRRVPSRQYGTRQHEKIGQGAIEQPVIELSVVVPAYNESRRLLRSLPALVAALQELDVRSEIVVVDDGSTDDTEATARRHLSGVPGAHVVRLPWNCGKGAAVRAGINVSRGEAVVFLDADLSSDLADLPRLVALLDSCDIAVGSRAAPGAVVTGRSPLRHLAAATYRRLVKGLIPGVIVDTQCGFKAFRAPVAKLLFSLTSSTGFGFDVEVLTLAAALGFRVTECPVTWVAVEGSHVCLRRDVPGMLLDLNRARRLQKLARSSSLPVVVDLRDIDLREQAPTAARRLNLA